MNVLITRAGLAALLATCCSPLLAHPGHAGTITGGIIHPLTGLDHVLAMVCIGLWAMRQTKRLRWIIPLGVLAFTAIGVAIGVALGAGGHVPVAVETAVAASVLLVGLLVRFSPSLPAALNVLLTATFALAHGLAHGSEMPSSAPGLQFVGGLLLGTALLLLAGTALAKAVTRQPLLSRMIGGAVASCGAILTVLAFQ